MMRKYFIIILFISAFSLYAQKYYDLYEIYYSSNDDYKKVYEASTKIKNLSATENQTMQNILSLLEVYPMKDKKIIYKKLSESLRLNTNDYEIDDPDYLASLADTTSLLTGYAPITELLSLAKKSRNLYERSLKINPSHFHSLLGLGLIFFHAPKIAGGNIETAFYYLKKAEENAKFNYQKYVIYVWISQVYFKLKDKENYNKYISLAEKIYNNNNFLKTAKEYNLKGKTI